MDDRPNWATVVLAIIGFFVIAHVVVTGKLP